MFFRSLCVLLISVLLMTFAHAGSALVSDQSEIGYGEAASEYLLKNDYVAASKILKEAVKVHPDSEWLRGQYGNVLAELGELEKAEDQYQEALELDKTNRTTKDLISEVHQTQAAFDDHNEPNKRDMYIIFLTAVISVAAVGLMGWLFARCTCFNQSFTFSRALKRKDWDVVTDILENCIANTKKKDLRGYLEKMHGALSGDENKVNQIIRKYVDVPQQEEDLLFFYKKMIEKRQ
ncbi:MAG: tetratricopeptide repeat protein [Desulfovibrio sp.]